jgi:hypothetical protein
MKLATIDMENFEFSTNGSSLSLAACLLVGTYFQYRSMKPPNPPPSADKAVKEFMV